jgi:hypothetical protein
MHWRKIDSQIPPSAVPSPDPDPDSLAPAMAMLVFTAIAGAAALFAALGYDVLKRAKR